MIAVCNNKINGTSVQETRSLRCSSPTGFGMCMSLRGVPLYLERELQKFSHSKMEFCSDRSGSSTAASSSIKSP